MFARTLITKLRMFQWDEREAHRRGDVLVDGWAVLGTQRSLRVYQVKSARTDLRVWCVNCPVEILVLPQSSIAHLVGWRHTRLTDKILSTKPRCEEREPDMFMNGRDLSSSSTPFRTSRDWFSTRTAEHEIMGRAIVQGLGK